MRFFRAERHARKKQGAHGKQGALLANWAIQGIGSAFFLSSCAALASLPPDGEQLRQIAQSRYWQLLLHYKKNMFGHARSLADGGSFFLSPEGMSDPYAELVADIRAFSERGAAAQRVGPLQQHPQCAFPERYRFLKETLHLETPDARCAEYEEWRSRFNPAGATLVFASAYLSNPASMFGHTFLRIDSKPRAGHAKKNDLLDYGINYSAKTGDDGGLTFTVLGLTGGYPGYFSLLPYFDKVKEYSDVESRDLWEYPIALSAEQIGRMIGHVWELGATYFDYFFFDENCSYHLLSLLEVANPDWHFTDEFPLWVIPSDTIRVLRKAPGVLAEPVYRPSLHRRLQARLEAMSPGERKTFERAKKQGYALNAEDAEAFSLRGAQEVEAFPPSGSQKSQEVEAFPRSGNAAIIDSLLDQQKYDLLRSRKNEDALHKEIQRRLLLARARLPARESDASGADAAPTLHDARNRPDIGAKSGKASVYGGHLRGSPYIGLQIRPAYHDLLDSDAGYQPFSEISFLRANARYYSDRRRFRVHELQFVEVTSLTPSDDVGSRVSWSAAGGLTSPDDLRCRNCTAFGLLGGGGESFWLAPRSQSALVFALLRAKAQYSGWFDGAFRFGPQAHAGFIAALSAGSKISLAADLNYYPTQRSKWSFEPEMLFALRVAENLELRLRAAWIAAPRSHGLDQDGALAWYF